VKKVILEDILKSKANPALYRLCSDESFDLALFKKGDDLHVDQFCLNMFRVFNFIWENENIMVKHENYSSIISNKCYEIAITNVPKREGFIEYIPECQLVKNIYDKNNFLYDYLEGGYNCKRNGWVYSISLLSSSVACFLSGYLLGLGDRKSGNMLIDPQNNLFNIDFGFINNLGALIYDAPHFPLAWGFVSLLKENYELFDTFLKSTWKALQAIVKNQDFVLRVARELNTQNNEQINSLITSTLPTSLMITEKELYDMIRWGPWGKLPKDILELFE